MVEARDIWETWRPIYQRIRQMDNLKMKEMYNPDKALKFLLVLYKLELLQVDDDTTV